MGVRDHVHGDGTPKVELWIDLDSTDAGDLANLADWLRQESRFNRSVREHRASPGPGEMGGAVELIIAISSLGLVPAFTKVLITWLKTRGGNVVVVLRNANGEKVEVRADNVRDPEKVIRQVSELVNPDDNGPAATV